MRSRILFAGAAGIALVCALTGCAPEPGEVAGNTGKGEEVINPETEWGGHTVIEETPVTVLPDSFPSDRFALPTGAVIQNTGESSESSWFVVLVAEDRAAADALWQEMIDANGLLAVEESENEVGGNVATFEATGLEVFAMMIPAADGPVQLSYELRSWS